MRTDLVGMGSLIGGSGGDGGAGGAASADIAVANFNVTNGNGAGVLVQSLGASATGPAHPTTASAPSANMPARVATAVPAATAAPPN